MSASTHIKTRREEERERLRDKILDAALQLATREGWSGVTIRKIAKIIRYSPPAIYRYFDKKDDIIATLYMRSLEAFKSYLIVGKKYDSVEEGIITSAEKYWDFGFENPQLYELLFTIKTPELKNEEDLAEGKTMFLDGLNMIKSVNPTLNFDQQHDFLANYFSLLHGFVHLALSEKLYTYENGAPDAKAAMLRAIKRYLKTIKDEDE